MEKFRPLFIGGKWVEAAGGKRAEVVNPATGKVIAQYAVADEKDVDLAVQAAKKAYEEVWSKTTPMDRANMLLKLADMLEANAEEFARLESIDVGKPIDHALGEISAHADSLRFYAGAARCLEGKAALEYTENMTSILRREPLGVCAGICPWNYPLQNVCWKAGAAMAAGNTIVLKPSSETPLTTLYFAELASEIIPAGVFNVVTGSGSVIGNALCTHPDVKLVSLTGSAKTGKKIAELCSATLKRPLLELGGKAPAIVFEDADIDSLVEGLRGGSFYNCGQDCGQACRILISDKIYDQVVERLVALAKDLKYGPTDQVGLDFGPMVSAAQRATVHGYVTRAAEAGAEILTGGKPVEGPGFYYEPTVIANVKQDSEIVQNEVFGPVITVQPFSSEEEAVKMANDVVYGLGSSVWTSDIKRALRVSKALQFGTVWVNTHGVGPSEMPWGGYKESGYGKDLSMYAMEDYTQIKHVLATLE